MLTLNRILFFLLLLNGSVLNANNKHEVVPKNLGNCMQHNSSIVDMSGEALTDGAVVSYDWPATLATSDKYSVKVYQNCDEYDLFTHYSVPNLLQGPDGDGVTGLHKDRSLSYVQFAFEGNIEIEVTKTYGTIASRVEISPKSFGIDPVFFDGRTVRFQLDHSIRPGYISVHFISNDNVDNGQNGSKAVKNGMMIFADKPETNIPDLNASGVVDYSQATANEILNANLIYFPPGDYKLEDKFPATQGRLYLGKVGQKLYIAGGAVIRGSIDADRQNNIEITGRGVITGRDYPWHFYQEGGKKTSFIDLTGSDNCKVEGIIIDNPTHHTIPSGKNTRMKNIKIIGWASNHDGVRAASGSFFEEIFIKTSDDLDYARDPHSIVNSVLWPMRNGAFGQLGWNNLGTGFTNYQNLYFIHSEWDLNAADKRNTGIIGSVLEQGVNLSNNVVKNIYAEDGTGMLANLTIEHESNGDPNPINGSWGEIKNFRYENIIMEKPFQNSGGVRVKNKIAGFERNGAKATIHDIDFINIIAGNEMVTNDNYQDYFDIDPNTTFNIDFRTEGPILNVNISNNGGGQTIPAGLVPAIPGMDRFIQIVADPGKKIERVIVDGVDKGRLQNLTFKSINNNHTVEVIFADGADYFGEAYDCMSVSTQDDFLDQFEIRLSPNPFSKLFTVELGEQFPGGALMIYDAQGKELKNIKINKHESIIQDILNAPEGIYFFKIQVNHHIKTWRMILSD